MIKKFEKYKREFKYRPIYRKPAYKSLSINNIVKYFWKQPKKIEKFIIELLTDRTIEFHCIHCTDNINGVTNFINSKQKHKGIVNGVGFGFDDEENKAYVTVTLQRHKHDHIVDTKQKINVFGYLTEEQREIIDKIDQINQMKKYNL